MKKGTTDVVDENTYSLEKEKIDIFPNPASDKITIRMPERTHGTTQYTITDQIGNIVRIGALPQTINEIDTSISNLPNGLYVFSAEINGKRVHQKFIITR